MRRPDVVTSTLTPSFLSLLWVWESLIGFLASS
jgi:hypothetical protein